MEIDWWTLAIQTVNFLVVVWLLSRFLYRPVRQRIEEREASDRAAAEEARAMAERAKALRAEYERKLADFAGKQREQEAELHCALRKERDEVLAEARQEAEAQRATARAEIEEARVRALGELRQEIAALAKDLAATALSETAKDPAHRIASELERQTEHALSSMRKDIAAGGTLVMETAIPLSEDERARVLSVLRASFGESAPTEFTVRPAIIGGVVLHFPHGVLDASVAGYLDRAASRMAEGEHDA